MIYIRIPHLPAITGNTRYILTITTTCGSNKSPGLYYPNSGTFDVSYDVSTLGSSVDDNGLFPLRVISSSDFSTLRIRWLWNNKNVATPVIIQFTPATTIHSNGKLVISFPSWDWEKTLKLFTGDLASGNTYSGQSFPCYSSNIYPTDSTTALSCLLYFSKSQNMAQIELVSFNSLPSGISYSLVLRDILNPNSNEDVTVNIRVHSEDGSGNVLNERVIYNVASPQDFPAASSGTVSLSTTPNLPTVQASSVVYTFSGITITANKLLPKRGRIVIVFPTSQSFSTVTGSGSTGVIGVFEAFDHIVIFTPITEPPEATITLILKSLSAPWGY